MSACPINFPVPYIDLDILWCIIKINADIRSHHTDCSSPIETTVALSHVCRAWRNFMLSTSSIWAHLIDLGDCRWRAEEGRQELIRRSGTALLWVKVPDFDGFTLHKANALLDVVVQNCHRIQDLEVTIGRKYVDQWPQLYLPAAHLESFTITFTEEHDEFHNIFLFLLGGSVPMLYELHFSGHRSNFFPLPPWINQLRYLQLDVKLTVSEMLGALILTKNLIRLQLDRVPDPDGRTTLRLPRVSLPKLTWLCVNLDFERASIAVLLDRLCIPPACSLIFSVHSITSWGIDWTNKKTFQIIIHAISTCVRPHFAYYMATKLRLDSEIGQLILKTETDSDGPTFEFAVELPLGLVFPMHMLSVVLSEFSLPGLSNVSWCSLTITGVSRPSPELTAFMKCLPSVNTITTHKLSLRHLRAWSTPKGDRHTKPRIGFPALKILKLVPIPHTYWHTSKYDTQFPNPIYSYVKARIMRGHAISIIDLTEETLDIIPDIKYLEKVAGLTVLWRQRGNPEIQEYICGMSASKKAQACL